MAYDSAPGRVEVQCVNCGARVSAGSDRIDGRYFECIYCGALVARGELPTFDSSQGYADTPQQQRLGELLTLCAHDIEAQDFSSAEQKAAQAILIAPSAWPAYVHRAVAVFWLGREDLEHLHEVENLLRTADTLSGNSLATHAAREDVAYNLALMGAYKERLGENIAWSFKCFEISCSLASVHSVRDVLVAQYCEASFVDIQGRLESKFARYKRQYDPAYVELDTLWCVLSYWNSHEVRLFWHQHASHHLQKNGSKSYAATLAARLDHCLMLLRQEDPTYTPRALRVGFWS